jgi:hypothetical protein
MFIVQTKAVISYMYKTIYCTGPRVVTAEGQPQLRVASTLIKEPLL